ncbi:MAG: PAS domain S-box protein [Chitinophagaceae bacterium]|nr:PAS domain S-box protein [Chitinophagaceae bacterium]
MQLVADVPLQERLVRWSRYLAIGVIMIAIMVLLGWQLDIDPMRRLLPGQAAMNPVTAICFLFASISFLLLTAPIRTPGKNTIAYLLASVVTIVGILKLAGLTGTIDWQIDWTLFTDEFEQNISDRSRNSIATISAICLVLTGIALFLMKMESRIKLVSFQLIAMTIALLGWFSILGYLYRVQSLDGTFKYRLMSVYTAASFQMLSIAMLLAQPSRGFMKQFTSVFSGRLVARLLLPAAVIVPTVLGLLRLYGDWIGIYNSEFGVAIYTLTFIILFVIITWYSARLLNKRDMIQKKSSDALTSSEEEVAAIFRAAPDAVIVIDEKSLVVRWNPEAEKMFVWKANEIIGRELTETIIPVEYRERHRRGMQRFLSTGENNILGKTVEVAAVRKDGTVFDISLRISPVLVKEARLFVGFVRDITEEKKTAEKLQSFNVELTRQVDEKTRELTQIFDRLTDGFIALDRQFKYTYLNKKAGEIIQHDPQSLIGINVWDVFPEAVGSSTYNAFLYVMEQRVPLINTDYFEPLDLWQENHIYPTPDGISVFVRDVTTRKRAELALKEKELKYRTLVEEAVDAILVLTPDGRYIEANKKAAELLGYSLEEMLTLRPSDIIFPEDKKPTPYEQLNAGESVRIERILRRKNGEGVAVETNARRLPDGNYLAFMRDVTERKRVEREIVDARKLSDRLIDSLPGVFYFFDSNGKFLRWNKQFEFATGFSASQIANMHPTEFFPEEEREYVAERIGGVFVKGVNDAEAHFLTQSGKKIPYYFKAVLINYQGQPCLLGNGIDITARKEGEKQMRLSEQKYKLLFFSNPQPMFMLSLPGYHIIEVNTSALLQYGYTKEEFLQLSVNDLRPSEDIEKFKAATNLAFRSIQHAGIWRHKKKDGSVIYVDITTHDIYYEDRPVRLILASDVTEKYTAEEKLKTSYESIRKLTDHLQNIREEERTHIAREIHDELGQQLTVLKMDVAWLSKRIESQSPAVKEKMVELLAMIDTTVKTVRRISSELRPSLLDDLGLIPAMEWHLEEFEKRSGILKEFTGPPKEIQLSDEIKIGLFRIFQESLTNVARHAQAKNVKINLEKNDKKVILTIKDDGLGFDEVNAPKKTLGILGMKERTIMLGGEYTITGVPGQGTTVSVAVPLNGSDHQNKMN